MSRIWAFALASLLVTGCSSVTGGLAPAVRTPPASCIGCSGLTYWYGGVARLRRQAPPAPALPSGGSDLLAACRAVLAANDLGIWRSTDGGPRWRAGLTGRPMWSLTAVAGGGFAAAGNHPGLQRARQAAARDQPGLRPLECSQRAGAQDDLRQLFRPQVPLRARRSRPSHLTPPGRGTFVPFLAFDPEIRSVICSTNASR